MRTCKISTRVSGFTLIELLITMALTSVVISFSYTGLTYAQKTYFAYREQNGFISGFTSFKNKLNILVNHCEYMTGDKNGIRFVNDSSVAELLILEKCFVLQKDGVADTCDLKPSRAELNYLHNSIGNGTIVNGICIDAEFKENLFRIRLEKEYDSVTKLKLKEEAVNERN